MSTIKERILQIAKDKGVAKKKFVEDFGMSYSSFTGEAKERPLNSNAIANIMTAYPDIDPVWLVTGKKLTLTDKFNTALSNDIIKSTENPMDKYVNPFTLKTDSIIKEQDVPMFNDTVEAGVIPVFQTIDKESAEDYLRIPNIPKCDGAVFVSGDSMYPLLKSGDIVVYKMINDFTSEIFWGEMYIVDVMVAGESYVSVKYVQKCDKGEEWIKLVSQNQHHQPKDIHLNQVKKMALVKASVRLNSMS